MSFYSIPLKAGQRQTKNVSGSLVLVDSLGAAAGVDVTLVRLGGNDGTTMPNRQAGFRLVEPYEGVSFQSAVDTVLLVFLSDSDVQLGTNGGAVSLPGGAVITNTTAQAIPVSIATPVTLNATAVQVNNTPAQAIPTIPYLAAVVTDGAPVAVAAASAVLLAASATRRGIRIKNVGANPVAIGGAALVFASAAVIIQPGETWNENEAPGAAWNCICGAGLASTLNIQTIA